MNTSTIEQSAAHEGHVASERAWCVGRGQRVKIARHGLRRRTAEAVVVRGTLVGDADDLTDAEFELVIALPEATDRPITVSSTTAHSIRMASHGVFRQRGRPPSLGLTFWATLELPELRGLTRRGDIAVIGDLNLNPVEPALV
jgi:hypothetical protein